MREKSTKKRVGVGENDKTPEETSEFISINSQNSEFVLAYLNGESVKLPTL